MNENESEEPTPTPPFRWNWQAMTMAGLTALMLVVPLGGVIYFLQGYLARPKPPVSMPASAAVNTQPLASALENAANSQLGGDHVKLDVDSEITLTLPADEIPARAARIAEQARAAGGSALEMSADSTARRVMIQVPASRRDLLRRALDGEPVDFSAVPAGADSAILNVTLKTP